MYASDRAVVSTLKQALDLAAPFDPSVVGVTVDTFHVWWDPEVLPQLDRAGAEGRIATYQVCDWRTPLPADVLLGRHYPGDGVIDFATLTAAVEATGYTGDIEVEIFNQEIWDTPFAEAVARTAAGFDAAVVPSGMPPATSTNTGLDPAAPAAPRVAVSSMPRRLSSIDARRSGPSGMVKKPPRQ